MHAPFSAMPFALGMLAAVGMRADEHLNFVSRRRAVADDVSVADRCYCERRLLGKLKFLQISRRSLTIQFYFLSPRFI